MFNFRHSITEKRGKLPLKVPEEFEGVDLIVHAGDITHKKSH